MIGLHTVSATPADAFQTRYSTHTVASAKHADHQRHLRHERPFFRRQGRSHKPEIFFTPWERSRSRKRHGAPRLTRADGPYVHVWQPQQAGQ